jgi:hypothetical protein
MACFSFPFTFSSSVVVALSLMLAFAHSSFFDHASSSGFVFQSSIRSFNSWSRISNVFSIRHYGGVTYGHTSPCICWSIAIVLVTIGQPSPWILSSLAYFYLKFPDIAPCILQPIATPWVLCLVVLARLSSPSAAQLKWLQAPLEGSKIQEPINSSNAENWKLTESNIYQLPIAYQLIKPIKLQIWEYGEILFYCICSSIC